MYQSKKSGHGERHGNQKCMCPKKRFFSGFPIEKFPRHVTLWQLKRGEPLMLRFILILIVFTGLSSGGDSANRPSGKNPLFSQATSFRSFFSGNVKKKNGDLKQVEKHCFQFSARTGSGLISDEVSGEFSFPGNENEDYSASSGNCFAGNAQTGSCGARASPLLKFT